MTNLSHDFLKCSSQNSKDACFKLKNKLYVLMNIWINFAGIFFNKLFYLLFFRKYINIEKDFFQRIKIKTIEQFSINI